MIDTSKGYYLIPRGLLDSFNKQGDVYSRADAMRWLIENAAHTTHIDNTLGIEIKRGEVLAARSHLAKVWSWSEQNVRTFIKLLQKAKIVNQQSTSNLTKLIICNYDIMQRSLTSNQPANQPDANQMLTSNQPHISKETKESNEIKKKRVPIYFDDFIVSEATYETLKNEINSGAYVSPTDKDKVAKYEAVTSGNYEIAKREAIK